MPVEKLKSVVKKYQLGLNILRHALAASIFLIPSSSRYYETIVEGCYACSQLVLFIQSSVTHPHHMLNHSLLAGLTSCVTFFEVAAEKLTLLTLGLKSVNHLILGVELVKAVTRISNRLMSPYSTMMINWIIERDTQSNILDLANYTRHHERLAARYFYQLRQRLKGSQRMAETGFDKQRWQQQPNGGTSQSTQLISSGFTKTIQHKSAYVGRRTGLKFVDDTVVVEHESTSHCGSTAVSIGAEVPISRTVDTDYFVDMDDSTLIPLRSASNKVYCNEAMLEISTENSVVGSNQRRTSSSSSAIINCENINEITSLNSSESPIGLITVSPTTSTEAMWFQSAFSLHSSPDTGTYICEDEGGSQLKNEPQTKFVDGDPADSNKISKKHTLNSDFCQAECLSTQPCSCADTTSPLSPSPHASYSITPPLEGNYFNNTVHSESLSECLRSQYQSISRPVASSHGLVEMRVHAIDCSYDDQNEMSRSTSSSDKTVDMHTHTPLTSTALTGQITDLDFGYDGDNYYSRSELGYDFNFEKGLTASRRQKSADASASSASLQPRQQRPTYGYATAEAQSMQSRVSAGFSQVVATTTTVSKLLKKSIAAATTHTFRTSKLWIEHFKITQEQLLLYGDVLYTLRPLIYVWLKYGNSSGVSCESVIHSKVGDCDNGSDYNLKPNSRKRDILALVISLVIELVSIQLTTLALQMARTDATDGAYKYYPDPNENSQPSYSPQSQAPETMPQVTNRQLHKFDIELKRRKTALFFYLLRSPVFDKGTLPLFRWLSKSLQSIPFISTLPNSVLSALTYINNSHFRSACSS